MSSLPKFTRDELERSVCRRSYIDFVRTMWDTIESEDYQENWHIPYNCDRIQACLERVFKGQPKKYDLVCNIPPGTTKSRIYSVFLVPWAWTRMPQFQFIGASYSEELALELSGKARDVILSDKYRRLFPEVQIRPDVNSKGLFENTEGGWRFAVGVNGSVVGRHAHAIGIDDPLNPQQALSDLDRKRANHWITHSLSTRKVNKTVTVTFLVQQRVHEDDSTEHFRKSNPRASHICLPAEIDPERLDRANVKPLKLIDRYVNGLLDPVRLNRKVLDEYKAQGELFFSGQFQQRPTPAEGGMFKVDRVKVGMPTSKVLREVRYWDRAGGTKKDSDWTVGVRMGLDKEGRFWVLDVERFKLDSFDRESRIKKVAEQDGLGVVIWIEQEPAASGLHSYQDSARNLAGFRVKPDKVSRTTGNKMQRADAFSTQVNAGNVWMVPGAWNDAWKQELQFFPRGRHDDQVDASSGGFRALKSRRVVGAVC